MSQCPEWSYYPTVYLAQCSRKQKNPWEADFKKVQFRRKKMAATSVAARGAGPAPAWGTSVPGLCGTGAGQEVHGDQGEETQSGLGAPGQDKVALNSPTDFSLGLAPTPHFIPPQAPCPPSLPYTLLGNEVIWKNNQKIERKKKAKKMGFFFSPFKHLVRHLPHG